MRSAIDLALARGNDIIPRTAGVRDDRAGPNAEALMSTVSRSRTSHRRERDPDPVLYGWRFVEVRRADGSEDFEQVPLTEEDVLHPKDGDYIVHSTAHAYDLKYLSDVFEALLASRLRAAVLSDCGVDLNLPRIKHVSPDIAVFFGVAQQRDWSIFDVAAEHAQAALIIEVTSASTRKQDFGRKLKYYHRAGVQVYVIVDAYIENKTQRRLELIGYCFAPAGYERIPLNANGRLWLEAVGVWLGVSQNPITGSDRVACFDPATNQEIGDYATIAKARELAEAEAKKAHKKAATANRKAAKAQQKAAKAQQTAKAETQARMAAEARIPEPKLCAKPFAPKS